MLRCSANVKERLIISEVTIFSFFESPSIWGIGLAIIFGAFWLLLLTPLGWKRPARWFVFLSGAFIFVPSIALVQLPLQRALSLFLAAQLGIATYERDIIYLSIPAVLISGIVQEAAKLIPIAIYWLIRKRDLMPRFGLAIGALVGAGYGVFEAQWLLSEIFAAGFDFSWLSAFGLIALGGFWERFFTVAFHTASGAVMGWGLAKGKWWLFYLFTTFWHFALNYTVVLYRTNNLSNLQVELLIAIMADIIFVFAFLLRWRTVKLPELEKAVLTAEPLPTAETTLPASDNTAPSEVTKQSETKADEPPQPRT